MMGGSDLFGKIVSHLGCGHCGQSCCRVKWGASECWTFCSKLSWADEDLL